MSSPSTSSAITSNIDRGNHVQLLLEALDKLDPDKNGLPSVPKDIISSTLTTRLKAICNINRLIEHSNDLSISFNEIGESEMIKKLQECNVKFRNWILDNKIIEHIFGPNCHVEIIKQSHTILNYVAHSLNDSHVDVIWSASLLKHCGRQVLDLLTSLIRFMKTGPVLHLYWLVKNLNIEDHSEHTLLLTSHILRYIWSHSPCINQIQFCALQKEHPQIQTEADEVGERLHESEQQVSHIKRRKSKRPSEFQEEAAERLRQRCMNPQDSFDMLVARFVRERRQKRVEQSLDSGSSSESEDPDKDLRQSIINVLKDSTPERPRSFQRENERSNSPVCSETLVRAGGDESDDYVKKRAVDLILKTISESKGTYSHSPSHNLEQSSPAAVHNEESADLSQCDPTETDIADREWLRQMENINKWTEFFDNTSDVSACCSEDKNMADFDDMISQWKDELDDPSSSELNVKDLGSREGSPKMLEENSNGNENHHRVNINDIQSESTASTSRDSDSRSRLVAEDSSSERFQQLSNESISHFMELKKASLHLSSITNQICADDDLKGLSEYNLANLSEPGKTLLWDLLQDGNIQRLSTNIHLELETVLINLVMSFGDRYIRYKFIEACLENLSVGNSVIISLRLLPRLMSFNAVINSNRSLSLPAINETYSIVLWAEKEHNMSQMFFKNLVDYYTQIKQTNPTPINTNDQLKSIEDYPGFEDQSGELFTHISRIIIRMSFLTFIYSKHFSPDSMKLNQEQMDQLWDCLTSDSNPKCSDVLFQWIYQQAVGEDFHGVDDELLDYVLKNKLPTLPPENFRLRGLKLLEQLLWIRQDYECCHEIDHPATKLLWDIALKAVDDEVSMAAIRILNHFYIYTTHQRPAMCEKGPNFMKNCMDHLQLTLDTLKNAKKDLKITSQALDVMQKVILLIRTHIEVFKAHWSYYLRILQLNNEAELTCHRLSAYDIKLPMTIRLVVQAASTMTKTTIEVQAGDFVGELRAEIVKWWYTQVLPYDRGMNRSSNNPASPSLLATTTATTSSSSSTTSHSSSASSHVNTKKEPQQDYEHQQQDQQQLNRENKSKSKRFSKDRTPKDGCFSGDQLNEFTAFLLAQHHSLRLLSHNQEIPFDWDERQINELDFKDLQVIYVLNDTKMTPPDTADDLASDKSDEPNAATTAAAAASSSTTTTQYPKPSTIPSIMLLDELYFERLMEVDQLLGSFQGDSYDLTNRAKTLSRRVWEIIQILPTSPHYKEDLKRCGTDDNDGNCWSLKADRCSSLLSAQCPQRLLYSLQIIDILKSSSHECPYWGSTFIRKGGLADLFDVFMSQKLLPNYNEDWDEWLQECLAYLLKLLFQFGTKSIQSPNVTDCSSSSSSSRISIGSGSATAAMAANVAGQSSNHRSSSGQSGAGANSNNSTSGGGGGGPIRRVRRNRSRFIGPTEERVLIPQFSEELLKLLANSDLIFDKLVRILKSLTQCRGQNDQCYYPTMSSRAMIVHHVMNFLASWCKSDTKFPEFNVHEHESLLRSLILEDTDASTRRETCHGFFKLHYASATRPLVDVVVGLGVSSDHSSSSNNTTLNNTSIIMNQSADACSSVGTGASVVTPNDDGPKDVHFEEAAAISDQSWTTTTSQSNATFSADLLSCLVSFLPIAEQMKPPKPFRNPMSESEYIKELNSPGCKDYFWLTCRLIDASNTCNISDNMQQRQQQTKLTKQTTSGERKSAIDLFELCEYLVVAIGKRKTFETRDYSVEDDALRGMLMMMAMALRRDQTFRYTAKAHQFVSELYGYLFAPPSEERRYLPKCKSQNTRSTAFDLMITLVERCPKNYLKLLSQLLYDQHQAVVKGSYPTDYWPHDDCRSEVGFVGLINLGATCYLATCMQHLFMIPDLRYAILSLQDTKNIRHSEIISELQKIFAFMLESERKAFNPRNFCKVYTMDNHPLNIAEQTDMTEFLTDLITKLEESSPGLRHIIKSLFSGTLSNNVVSLDCPHISRTTEEFYTLRVQVADMRNLNDSLDELTVKDTLEGDNMYTCSTCERKVRAEKRACIVTLPRILCFNTMRYTFNMTTMTKEKVNTHFSFPLRLDMADYLEENLMKRQQSSSSSCSSSRGSPKADSGVARTSDSENGSNGGGCSSAGKTEGAPKGDGGGVSPKSSNTRTTRETSLDHESDTIYELIGVTVHTGNADGGHYYCFIRDCEDQSSDKPRWYLFNDAEVKPFDDSHLGTECYGGELTTKSYDAINDRFMDFSIEKTNSAYMLFYKRADYKYRSRSVALRYLESDTERNLIDSVRHPTGVANQADQTSVAANKQTDECDDDEDDDDKPSPSAKMDIDAADDLEEQHVESTRKSSSSLFHLEQFDFNKLCEQTYDDFKLPRHLANWVWNDNLKFTRDKYIFEHHYFNFMWHICSMVPRTLNQIPENVINLLDPSDTQYPEDTIALETVHLAITFVLGVLMNSRERPNLSNWTELIRKQFNTSKAACDWLMQLIDDEETWLKQMLLKCPIEMVRQLFQRLCNDLTGSKQHKKLRLVK